jgi:hypothetical protein
MAQKRLDYLTRALVLKLRTVEPDRSIASIAQVVGVSEASARRILQAHTTDVKGLTHELLVSGVLDRLDNWDQAARVSATNGFHKASREWLEAAEVIDRRSDPAITVDARPTITVNIPFVLGALQPPTVPASASPTLPDLDAHARLSDTPDDTR